MPLSRRLPKRGFRNRFRKKIVTINIDQLKQFSSGAVIDEQILFNSGIIKRKGDGIKVLGKGTLETPLSLKLSMISRSAKEKILAAGGTILEVA